MISSYLNLYFNRGIVRIPPSAFCITVDFRICIVENWPCLYILTVELRSFPVVNHANSDPVFVFSEWDHGKIAWEKFLQSRVIDLSNVDKAMVKKFRWYIAVMHRLYLTGHWYAFLTVLWGHRVVFDLLQYRQWNDVIGSSKIADGISRYVNYRMLYPIVWMDMPGTYVIVAD